MPHLNGDGRISAAVRVNGELRSMPTDLPADVRVPIYSITKTLTAICVLRLAEMGTLRLGDAVPDTPLGRVPVAVFVSSSCGRRANDCEATLLARVFDDAS